MKSRSVLAVFVLAVLFAIPPETNALTLGEALDAPELVWVRSRLAWTAQTNNTSDGIDAASYATSYSGTSVVSWVSTFVTGPGELAFDWKLDIDNPGDWSDLPHLRWSLDNEVVLDVSTSMGWRQESVSIPEGRHYLKCDILCNTLETNHVIMSKEGRRDYKQGHLTDVSVFDHLLWVGRTDGYARAGIARVHTPSLMSAFPAMQASRMTYSAGLSRLGYEGSKPVGMSVVSGLSAQVAQLDSESRRGGGIVTLGNTSFRNGLVPLVAKPDPGFIFLAWDDGSKEASRMIRATGHSRHFVARFRHKFQGTWEGRGGTHQVRTSLLIEPHFGYYGRGGRYHRGYGWYLDGYVLWPRDDRRNLRSISTSGQFIGFRLDGGDSWRLELSGDGNRLKGKGRKSVYSANTDRSEYKYYTVELWRQ